MLKNQQQESKQPIAIKDQVLDLYSFGISTQEIADILGKTRNSIDIHLTTLRKEGKLSKKNQAELTNENEEITDEEKTE
jgi:DNA-binding CsgD family transcriptional regulator